MSVIHRGARELTWSTADSPAAGQDERWPRRRSRCAPWLAWLARAVGPGGRLAAAGLLAVIIAGVVVADDVFGGVEVGSLSPIEVFATAVASFLPGWLFVRFLAYRAGPLWNEYVLNLYRLGVDSPGHLPPPPETSMYYDSWRAAAGRSRERPSTIYQQKFDAYYGKNVSRASDDQDAAVRYETLFPVLLTTAITAAGWVMVFRGGLASGGSEPDNLGELLGFAFLGAYLFNLQMLMRRFFQSDLKASAYAGAAVRVITALLVVAVVYWLPEPDLRGPSGAVVAFVVGVFPLVGIQVLTRTASAALRTVVPTLRSDYPLSEIDGLNLWYEARLVEEGIEDMQNLITMNVVDVMLHTRVPVGRLVDWLDQAVLYTSLPRSGRAIDKWRLKRNAGKAAKEIRSREHWADDPLAPLRPYESRHPRVVLRRCGVRTATSFVSLFRPLEGDAPADAQKRAAARATQKWLCEQDPAWGRTLRSLNYVLAGETALEPVWAWRCWRQHDPDGDPAAGRHNDSMTSARAWSLGWGDRSDGPIAAAGA